ncbi:hypothetical protein Barba22A_gp135 [Rheinheimera phage vB_RspM_Barba22A]|jgi:hypothetical protein|uniref:Uncharacterized protein n=83 Tax=Barbavirus TaxID=2733095 RepID=A0A7G9VS24_9CAUD|nr:hypothetical protein HOV44_gp144 [Rheinheimera phage Barba5S]YP_009822876.1 hypothetical protein HOV45_gp140 [Rheinheimera phage Barba8S]YP_009823012.1 hypothetical protein HOV46_gp135 [Rheinheimera phage vB_RspM_Barba18A]YP_009823155.1 hypothetical protein HOV47_gp142 [Rheinheimera phage vB_RspM_Barba19A]QCQ57986.1 hypothetical protein Barba1A_gp135 [Rheinheimera phage vB_RspM_Barba1A]QCQ58122.1 hypothetical protein Barba1S_gp135 [Rheinheimera phage vB_RspM_Barba1S]QCQ58258.1 hypothetical
MTIATDLYLGQVIDIQSKEIRTAESILKKGDWFFTQLGNYTSVAPLSISNGVTSKIAFQPEDITYTNGNGFTTQYDFVNQKFMPTTLNDLFTAEVRFKFKCSAQDGHFDVKLESPDFDFNPVSGLSVSSTKSAGVEQFASIPFTFFIGQDLIDNGLEFKITPFNTNIQVYDISYLVVRLCSGR